MPLLRKKPPKDSDLEEIQAITGLILSETYRRTYTMYSGSKAEEFGPQIHVTFPDGVNVTENVQAFLTVDDVRKHWRQISYLRQFVAHFALDEEFVEPEFLIPIADVYCGVIYMAVGGRHVDKLFLADNGDFGIAWVADDVDDFLNSIRLQ